MMIVISGKNQKKKTDAKIQEIMERACNNALPAPAIDVSTFDRKTVMTVSGQGRRETEFLLTGKWPSDALIRISHPWNPRKMSP